MKPHPHLAGKQMLFYILSYLAILFYSCLVVSGQLGFILV